MQRPSKTPVLMPSADNIAAAGAMLRAGELVGMPTETVYGLAANALDPAAVARIFESKQRPAFDPLIVHVADVDAVSQVLAEPLSGAGLALAEAFWPGPLTLVAPRAAVIPDLVTSGLSTVAVRVPAHPVARALIRAAGVPLAAPSANVFGRVSPTRAQHVIDQLDGHLGAVLDGGPCEHGVESTIVSLAGDAPVVLRFGGLTVEAIEAVVGPVATRLHSSDRPEAPGQLSRHYATRAPLRLVSADALTGAPEQAAHKTLLVVAGPPPAWASAYAQVVTLSPSGDLRESAHRLFATLRELDAAGLSDAASEAASAAAHAASQASIDVIPCEPVGLGRAILDRLRRAAVLPD